MSKSIRVLLVDDDAAFRQILERELVSMGFEVEVATEGSEALERVKQREFDVVLLDVRMRGLDGVRVLEAIKVESPLTEVVMLTGHGTVDDAVHSMKLGAYDFLAKPCQLEELQSVLLKAHEKRQLARENALLKRQLTLGGTGQDFIGRSAKLAAVLDLVRRVAPSDSTVLIEGGSGVGKELVAHALHRYGARAEGPFVVLDCTALQEELLHSELFGHERGAFTGATALKPGLFEAADGGTIFLDEIAELTPVLQTKLLRVLETGSFRRLGGVRDLRVDTRVVTATNRDLRAAVAAGTFREDLYYRINVVTITVPPLRERREDIPLLAEHFVRRGTRGKPAKAIAPETMALLAGYDWPGNVRELQNIIERALLLSQGETLLPGDLPSNLRLNPKTICAAPPGAYVTLDDIERKYIVALIDEFGGSRKAVAQALGVTERTLYRKLRRHRISS